MDNLLVTRLTPAERTRLLADDLTRLWRRSVDATHGFVSREHLDHFETLVPEAILAVPVLFVARVLQGEQLVPVGFAGIDGDSLEMLFVDADKRGRGIGRFLLAAALAEGVVQTTANEDNAPAVGFYRHAGFDIVHREPLDPMGLPYPTLSLRLRED